MTLFFLKEPPVIDINVDEKLRHFIQKEGVKGYVVFNNDGILKINFLHLIW